METHYVSIPQIKLCRSCGSSALRSFFDLGFQPLANSLLKDPDEPENFYPLSLSFCDECSLVQLNHTVDPKALFSHYVWVTGTSDVAQKYAFRFADELLKRGPGLEGSIVEVASNDGTFLRPFVNRGMKVLGIDPAANVVELALANGIPTKCAFFGVDIARQVVTAQGEADFVFARNVLPHVANLHDFTEGLALLLSERGVLAVEVHDARIIQEELHYDSIYHEHLCYFTAQSLERLLNRHGLYFFDIARSPISGGSMIVYARKKRPVESQSIPFTRALSGKRAEYVNTLDAWQKFAERSREHANTLKSLIENAAAAGNVVGYGASARSSTLLNFMGILPNHLTAIADKAPLKQGRFTAGTHIPIMSPEAVMKTVPSTIVLLAWNFTDEIVQYLQNEFGYCGRYIIPLPNTPQTAKSQNYALT